MMSFDDIQIVSLSRINLDEETYRITTDRQKNDISLSISCVGMINPPILLPRDGAYIIVCGFRRVLAAAQLRWTDLPAKVLDSNISHLACIQLAIADNAGQRPLNPVEASRAINLLISSISDSKELIRISNALGLPVNDRLIEKMVPVCQLSLEIQEGILSNDISLSVALMLAAFDPNTAKMFATLFNRLKISLSKQREIITLMQEISLREDRSILSVLKDEAIQSALNDSNLDRARKTDMIRTYLKRKRFPAITQAKTAYEILLKSLQLGHTAKLIPPPDFEGTHYTLNLSFSNPHDLKKHIKTIDRLLSHPDFCNLIDSTK
ncbi:MAG: ParB/RepB/Spo0J family partition protein [Desulfobacterales bacterium]|jgi:ParB family chromosome partitioning protein|nr:ParB/RepB/Spo0J family partition protein [Desulfobacterales bacterium]